MEDFKHPCDRKYPMQGKPMTEVEQKFYNNFPTKSQVLREFMVGESSTWDFTDRFKEAYKHSLRALLLHVGEEMEKLYDGWSVAGMDGANNLYYMKKGRDDCKRVIENMIKEM